MPVLLLPQFIADLQEHRSPHFARRVLQKTLRTDGRFRKDANDHRFKGIENAWVRYISRGRTAYRVIYLRSGEHVYLFRAGEHAVEDRLATPSKAGLTAAVPVEGASLEFDSTIIATLGQDASAKSSATINRFRRNIPYPEINREIFARRNLPHRDIWLITPFINAELLLPTAPFGKLLFDQAEDGASISVLTSPPKDKNIGWMENLSERKINIFIYPRLHTKLYCFILDENRRYERGVPVSNKIASLILIGSANLTKAGLALDSDGCNEELCYMVSEHEIGHVETYVTELMTHSYELPEVRMYLARQQWQKLETGKW